MNKRFGRVPSNSRVLNLIRYLKGAIVPGNNNLESPPEVSTGRRRDYIPSAHLGSRLPHMYVRVNKSNQVCINLSILYNHVVLRFYCLSSSGWSLGCHLYWFAT